jgi:hypothetical protein
VSERIKGENRPRRIISLKFPSLPPPFLLEKAAARSIKSGFVFFLSSSDRERLARARVSHFWGFHAELFFCPSHQTTCTPGHARSTHQSTVLHIFFDRLATPRSIARLQCGVSANKSHKNDAFIQLFSMAAEGERGGRWMWLCGKEERRRAASCW